MLLQVFACPTQSNTFQNEFLFQTDRIISYTYTKKFVGTGNFTLVLPITKQGIEKIVEDNILHIDGDWLLVNNIKRDKERITVTGTDLNGFLDTRITTIGTKSIGGIYNDYDPASGTTDSCIAHYIKRNATEPSDSERKIPRLVIGQRVQGKEKDSYLARLQPLSEVVCDLCKNATIGYEIVGDLESNTFIFNMLAGTDRSIAQTIRTPIIFSRKRGNLFSEEFERGNENLVNAIYATGAEVTRVVYRDYDIPSGIKRKESAIDVAATTVSDIEDYALNQTSGNIANNSYEVDIRAIDDFGVKYQLGDYVTIKDSITGQAWTAKIEEVTKTISAADKKLSLTIGEAKTKLLNKIQNQANTSSKSESTRAAYASYNTSTSLIGAKGGYIQIRAGANNKPCELLTMDNDDVSAIGSNVLKLDKNGLFSSVNGYSGAYKKVVGIDGKVSAGAIEGVLSSQNGRIVIDLNNETISIDNHEIKAMTYTSASGDVIKYWGWE